MGAGSILRKRAWERRTDAQNSACAGTLRKIEPAPVNMNAITLNEAKNKLDHLIAQVIADAEPAIICSDKGEKAVLLSLHEFNSWQETLYLLSNPANAEHLRKSIAEAKKGKTIESL